MIKNSIKESKVVPDFSQVPVVPKQCNEVAIKNNKTVPRNKTESKQVLTSRKSKVVGSTFAYYLDNYHNIQYNYEHLKF